MTIVTLDLSRVSLPGGGWRSATALGVLDQLLAAGARANAAEALEETLRRRRHRRFEESEMLLMCAASEPAARSDAR